MRSFYRFLAAVLLLFPLAESAGAQRRRDSDPEEHQDKVVDTTPGRGLLNIGPNHTGLSIGNSAQWNGVRINFRDRGVQRLNGVNISIWKAANNANRQARMHGLNVGIVGTRRRLSPRRSTSDSARSRSTRSPASTSASSAWCRRATRSVSTSAVSGLSPRATDRAQPRWARCRGPGGHDGPEHRRTRAGVAGRPARPQCRRASPPWPRVTCSGVNIGGLAVVAQRQRALPDAFGPGQSSVSARSRDSRSPGWRSWRKGMSPGLNLTGLAMVGGEDVTGLSVAGLALVADRRVAGARHHDRADLRRRGARRHGGGVAQDLGPARREHFTVHADQGRAARAWRSGSSIRPMSCTDCRSACSIARRTTRASLQWLPLFNFHK